MARESIASADGSYIRVAEPGNVGHSDAPGMTSFQGANNRTLDKRLRHSQLEMSSSITRLLAVVQFVNRTQIVPRDWWPL